MILDAPAPEEAIWRRLETRRPSSAISFPRSRAALRSLGTGLARLPAALGRPGSFFSIAVGLWSAPAIAVSRLDPDRSVAEVVRILERRPILACLGFAAAAVYVVATALLLAVASRRLTQERGPLVRATFRVGLALALLPSLAGWIILATGCLLAAMLWIHAVWP